MAVLNLLKTWFHRLNNGRAEMIFGGQRERSAVCSESNGQSVTPSPQSLRFAAVPPAAFEQMRHGDGCAGAGDGFERGGLWEHGRDFWDQPASAARAAVYGEGQASDSPVHERRAVAGRYVRSKADAPEVRW